MPTAEITYNAGRSYRIKSTKFVQHRTEVVTDPDVIARCQITAGFSVRILQEKGEKKVIAKPKKVKKAPPAEVKEKVVRETVETKADAKKKRTSID